MASLEITAHDGRTLSVDIPEGTDPLQYDKMAASAAADYKVQNPGAPGMTARWADQHPFQAYLADASENPGWVRSELTYGMGLLGGALSTAGDYANKAVDAVFNHTVNAGMPPIPVSELIFGAGKAGYDQIAGPVADALFSSDHKVLANAALFGGSALGALSPSSPVDLALAAAGGRSPVKTIATMPTAVADTLGSAMDTIKQGVTDLTSEGKIASAQNLALKHEALMNSVGGKIYTPTEAGTIAKRALSDAASASWQNVQGMYSDANSLVKSVNATPVTQHIIDAANKAGMTVDNLPPALVDSKLRGVLLNASNLEEGGLGPRPVSPPGDLGGVSAAQDAYDQLKTLTNLRERMVSGQTATPPGLKNLGSPMNSSPSAVARYETGGTPFMDMKGSPGYAPTPTPGTSPMQSSIAHIDDMIANLRKELPNNPAPQPPLSMQDAIELEKRINGAAYSSRGGELAGQVGSDSAKLSSVGEGVKKAIEEGFSRAPGGDLASDALSQAREAASKHYQRFTNDTMSGISEADPAKVIDMASKSPTTLNTFDRATFGAGKQLVANKIAGDVLSAPNPSKYLDEIMNDPAKKEVFLSATTPEQVNHLRSAAEAHSEYLIRQDGWADKLARTAKRTVGYGAGAAAGGAVGGSMGAIIGGEAGRLAIGE